MTDFQGQDVVPLADFAEALEDARPAMFTLVGLAVALGPADHHLQHIAELLSKTNDLFDELEWRT